MTPSARSFDSEMSQSRGAGARATIWHNQPYTPKRSFLYQFLCIASGYIPPKLNILSQLDADGNVGADAHGKRGR